MPQASRTRTRTKRTPHRRGSTAPAAHPTKAADAPLGLRALYAALLLDGEDTSIPLANVEACLPVADRILNEDLDQFESIEAFEARLMAHAQAEGLNTKIITDDAEQQHRDRILAFESFRVGVATCWRLMTAINGGGR